MNIKENLLSFFIFLYSIFFCLCFYSCDQTNKNTSADSPDSKERQLQESVIVDTIRIADSSMNGRWILHTKKD